MSESQWTFLSNHGHVLVYISKNPDARVRDIATSVGITERSAQGIIADLESDGYLSVERVGRRNSYRVNASRKFRHPAESNKSIAPLIKIFAS